MSGETGRRFEELQELQIGLFCPDGHGSSKAVADMLHSLMVDPADTAVTHVKGVSGGAYIGIMRGCSATNNFSCYINMQSY